MEQKTSNPERVFISYASPDIDQAVEVEEHLRRHQIETFRDRQEVRESNKLDLVFTINT